MRILILTYGTQGDVQPYVALAQRLQAKGHTITVATSIRFRDFVERRRVGFMPMTDALLSIMDTQEGREVIEDAKTILDTIRVQKRLGEQINAIRLQLLKESWKAAQTIQPDLIIYHPTALAGPYIAEKLGITAILATPFPMYTPTSEMPFFAFPDLKLGGWYNRLSYQLMRTLMGRMSAKVIQEFRQSLGLPSLTPSAMMKIWDAKDRPVLHAYSEVVLPRPADWPEKAHVTGYWFLDEETDWSPPQEVQKFLAAGPPPVYIGFGSMAGRHPERLATTVIMALKRAKLRGLIATGWGGLKPEDLPDTILKVEHLPHSWLFPRVSAVVHHGGAGTTAAVLRAGKPSVVVPFFGDQPFWAKRLHHLGVATKPIPLKQLDVERMTAALLEVTSQAGVKDTAYEIRHYILEEDGIAKAIALIEANLK